MKTRASNALTIAFRSLTVLWFFSLGGVLYALPDTVIPPCKSAGCQANCALSSYWCFAGGAGTTVNWHYITAPVCEPATNIEFCHKITPNGGSCVTPIAINWEHLPNAQYTCPFDLVPGSLATQCTANGTPDESGTTTFNTKCQ